MATPTSDPITTPETHPQNPPSPTTKRKRDDETQTHEEDDSKNPKPTSQSQHPLYKTSLCSYFRSGGSGNCSHGDECRFAHSEDELRPRPDGSWDPTSQRGKKAKKDEIEGEGEGGDEVRNVMMMTEVLEEGGDPMLSKCLVHVPRKWTSTELDSFLADQGVIFKSARKKKGMTVGFITFEAAEQVKAATELLAGKYIGNKTLKVGDVIPRSYDEKIQSARQKYQNVISRAPNEAEASLDSNDDGNAPEANGSASNGKSARDVVTPLAHLSYSEQLEHKKNSLMQILKRLTRNARKACPRGVALPDWVVKSKEIGGLPCSLAGIIESPLINGYRNKCEFSVGYSVHQKPTVGFMLGNFREGVTAVEEPSNCPNVSRIACSYALIFQEFLQHSTLPIWNRFNNTGFWRQLTVREGRKTHKEIENNHEASVSEVMLIVQVSTEGHDEDLINRELQKLAQSFAAGAASASPPLPLTALAVQDHKGISNVAPADAPLRPLLIPNTAESSSDAEMATHNNETRIHDYIGNLRFSISPTAFFQVNTLAAEKLYSLAGDWADLDQDTLLFDVCCGTGTIGLTLADRVGMVVGIEMNASAVSDAQRNAEINGITNCKFICSKAEDVMGSLLREYLDDSQETDDTSNPSDNGEKQNDTAGNESSSLNDEPNPENLSNEVKAEMNHGCDPKEKQEDLQTNNVTKVSSKQHFKNVVAIVDPPRSGLHPVVVKALRTHPLLKRLVYISCNPESLVANAIELCTPLAETREKGNKNHNWRRMSNAGVARNRLKSMPKSEPFQPVKAMAVDLFPHTPHCELVMLLER